jgi:hypothetical protein
MKNIHGTFSLSLEGYVYTWRVLDLIKISKNINAVEWTIPESFINEWTWDNDSLEEHLDRCIESEINIPIIVWDGKVLDGCHRIIKSIALNKNVIDAKIIRDIPPPHLIIKEEEVFNCKPNYNFKEMVELVKNKLKQ